MVKLPSITAIVTVDDTTDLQLLEVCVNSILNQKNVNTEVTLVGQYERDALRYYRDNHRVWYLALRGERDEDGLTEKIPYGKCLNYGMFAAEGDYFSFVDACDFISETFYYDLVKGMVSTGHFWACAKVMAQGSGGSPATLLTKAADNPVPYRHHQAFLFDTSILKRGIHFSPTASASVEELFLYYLARWGTPWLCPTHAAYFMRVDRSPYKGYHRGVGVEPMKLNHFVDAAQAKMLIAEDLKHTVKNFAPTDWVYSYQAGMLARLMQEAAMLVQEEPNQKEASRLVSALYQQILPDNLVPSIPLTKRLGKLGIKEADLADEPSIEAVINRLR